MKKKTIKAQPVSTREAKISFIRANAKRIAAVKENPTEAAALVVALAAEMLAKGLYLKTTAKTDRCRTVYLVIQELGFWEASIVRQVSMLLWQRKVE